MAETQPVTIPVSCLDENNREELHPSESVAAAANNSDAVNDDCVRSSSVEVGHDTQGNPRNDEKDSLQAANSNSVIAGLHIDICVL